MSLHFDVDRSSMADVLHHLQAQDNSFRPPLSSRVDLPGYSRKLVEHAVRLEAWDGVDLVGLVAVYVNSKQLDAAFVSNVSVLARYSGKGIARHLMKIAIARVADLGFSSVQLKVDRGALIAMRLYLSLGFQPTAESDDGTASMKLLL